MTEFLIGAGITDITPPVGIEMSGFAGRGNSTGINAPLQATVTVFAEGGPAAPSPRFTLVSLELLVLFQSTVDRIRGQISKRLGLPTDAVAVVSTHTHYGPMTMDGFGKPGPGMPIYLDLVERRIMEAVEEAASKLTPARLRIAHGETSIGINRRERTPDGEIVLGRNPDGVIDRELTVLSIEAKDGRQMGLWINAACHPVCQGHTVTGISGDFPGVLCATMSRELECPVTFLQGACGNINPCIMEPDYSAAQRTGWTIAGEVRALLPKLQPCSHGTIRCEAAGIDLPPREAESVESAEAETEQLLAELRRSREGAALESWTAWLEMKLRFASGRLESIRTGVPLPPIGCEIQVMRAGDFAVAALQGELFCEIGQAVKQRSPVPHTMVSAYNGDWISYVPVASAYPEGGYEVNEASRVGPAAAGAIVEETLRLLALVA